MSALLLLLVSSGVLLCSTGAQENYDSLPDNYRKGVDVAVQQLHLTPTVQHHFLFLRTIHKSDIQPGFDVTYIYHNFYLKATHCPKGTSDSKRCQFRDDRPLIDCAVCYKIYGGEIEQEPKPYIHCIRKPSLSAEMKKARVAHCDTYSSGSSTLLASRTDKTNK